MLAVQICQTRYGVELDSLPGLLAVAYPGWEGELILVTTILDQSAVELHSPSDFHQRDFYCLGHEKVRMEFGRSVLDLIDQN
jgi:hypothetical protein